jgi:dolichol kinase
MQTYGVTSLLFSIVSMFFIYIEYQKTAQVVFGISLLAFCWSIFLSLIEIRLSTKAIEIELSDMEGLEDPSVMDYLKKKFERD